MFRKVRFKSKAQYNSYFKTTKSKKLLFPIIYVTSTKKLTLLKNPYHL